MDEIYGRTMRSLHIVKLRCWNVERAWIRHERGPLIPPSDVRASDYVSSKGGMISNGCINGSFVISGWMDRKDDMDGSSMGLAC